MRVRYLFQVTMWVVLCVLILHIITLTFLSSSRSWIPSSSSSSSDDSASDELFWSSREISSINSHLDRESLLRFENSRWRLAEVTANSKTGPIQLHRQPSLLKHRKLEPDFKIESPTANRSLLRTTMHKINADQIVLNTDLYNRTDYVVAIQVHDRTEYLRLLIESLRRAKDIHRALLVFSHDVYSADMNRLVRSIGFAKVVQIFFPYSQQMYPNVFPGFDPKDCPRDVKKAQ